MNTMNYDDLKTRLYYSEAMRANTRKAAKIQGYVDESEYTRILEGNVESISFDNHLDVSYAEFLAVARSIGTVPEGREGVEALKELFGEDFIESEETVRIIESILKTPVPDEIKQDIAFIKGEDESGTREAKAVKAAEDVMETISLYTPEEKEKLGGPVMEQTLLDGVKIDDQGRVYYSDYLKKVMEQAMSRRKPLDRQKIQAVKRAFKKRMLDAALDEPGQKLDRILGE